MKRTVPLLVASALVATTTAVVAAATGPAGAEPAATAAVDGKLIICHTGLGTQGRINETFGRENLESGTATSGASTTFRNVRGCAEAADGIDERTRFSLSYFAKKPYRLKSVRVQQTDGSTVTVARRSGNVRVLMDAGEEVTVTFSWGRPKRR